MHRIEIPFSFCRCGAQKKNQAFGAAAEGGGVPREDPQRRTRELQDGQTAAGAAAFGELRFGNHRKMVV